MQALKAIMEIFKQAANAQAAESRNITHN